MNPTMRRLLRYLRPYWKLGMVSGICTLLIAGTSLLLPWPLQLLFDYVLAKRSMPPFVAYFLGPLQGRTIALFFAIVGLRLGITLLHNLMVVASEYVNTRIDQGIALDVRSELFQHAQRLSLSFHDQRRSGQLIYAINFQAQSAASLIMAVQPLVQSALLLIGMLWISWTLDPPLALLSLTVIPFLYFFVRYYARNIQSRLTQVKGMEGESLSIIHEAVSMMRVIVAFGRESYEYRRFRGQAEEAMQARVQLTLRQTLFSLSVNMTTAVGTALVMALGAYHAMSGRITGGELLIILTYISSVYDPLESISNTVGNLQEHFVNLRMSLGLLDKDPEIKDPPHPVRIDRARGEVAFENVQFSYTGREDTLRDVSFSCSAGQVVAIVGPTGAGKTTLISLIPRFYDSTGGRILIDGTDSRELSLRSLRNQISMVLQEPLLFSATIAENIRYGRLNATMNDIIEAAKSANAHDFIMTLPQKYETVLGERGSKLSGGERQRISVARAFLRDAPILILDEPTSSIDSKTEAVILDALMKLMVGRTTFMVAHRLSTIHHADLILVLNRGRIVEQGTHDSLLAASGLYRQLHDMQTGVARRRLQRELRLPAASYAGLES